MRMASEEEVYEEEYLEDELGQLEESSQQKKKKVRKSAPRLAGTQLKEEDIEKFITLVETHPCIYDASSSEASKRNVRDNAWRSIADAMENKYTTNVCRAKWQNLRSQHRRHESAMKNQKSGSAQVSKPRWKYYTAMQFVSNSAAKCTTVSHSNLVNKSHLGSFNV